MLGGLHIAMAFWNTSGDLMDETGGTIALPEADVTPDQHKVH